MFCLLELLFYMYINRYDTRCIKMASKPQTTSYITMDLDSIYSTMPLI